MLQKFSKTSKSFRDNVLDVVSKIPRGKTLSYGEVARRAGNSRAARAVGAIMRTNTDKERVPCHRVICANGDIGGYNGGEGEKRRLLKAEGAIK